LKELRQNIGRHKQTMAMRVQLYSIHEYDGKIRGMKALFV
jgi:hypothetical protein